MNRHPTHAFHDYGYNCLLSGEVCDRRCYNCDCTTCNRPILYPDKARRILEGQR